MHTFVVSVVEPIAEKLIDGSLTFWSFNAHNNGPTEGDLVQFQTTTIEGKPIASALDDRLYTVSCTVGGRDFGMMPDYVCASLSRCM